MPSTTKRKSHKQSKARLVQSELKKCGLSVFYLDRREDVHGVSGTGCVAIGLEMPSGKCVVEWLSEYTTETIFENIDQVEKIHGHQGKTLVVRGLPPPKR